MCTSLNCGGRKFSICTSLSSVCTSCQQKQCFSFRYIEANVRSYGQCDSSVPPFLWDRPADVIQHITSCMDSSLSEGHVVKLGDGVFRVKSETQEDQSYELAFGSDDSLPSCQCDDWRRYKLPCKHFCAVFQKVPGWTWQQLSLKYREHPLLNLDATCCSMTPDSVDKWGTEVVSEPVTCKGKVYLQHERRTS